MLGKLPEIIHVKCLVHSTQHIVSIQQIVVSTRNHAQVVPTNTTSTKCTLQKCTYFSLGHLFHYPRPPLLPAKKQSSTSANILRTREWLKFWYSKTGMHYHADILDKENFIIPRKQKHDGTHCISTSMIAL